MSIKDFNDKPHFPERVELISCQIQMNTLLKTNYERKRVKCYRSIHKAIRIPVDIHKNNKRFYVTVKPKNACKLESVDHLWPPFLDEPQSDIVVFANNLFSYI